ncbi:MAG TPA: asparagine synthase (glutamine-hydrolyzing) [Gemmatimonadota bacterium]|nr:asparagine synthase (glutamine-hydrolyzing) [Gemmatimonadota bacterium]
MCGIVGSLSFGEWDPDEPDRIAALARRLARRGPDDQGAWTDDRRCALGFRRLSILDLSARANQPMVTGDGRAVMVFNGEIYNFRDLRRRLESLGRRFRTTGDTEVLLHALAQWGRDALPMLNGMYALAYYEPAAGRLLLARDHAGIKPLYWAATGQGVVFASEYRLLRDHPWPRSRAVSPTALRHYLQLGYIPAPLALHEDSGMLEPGTWMEFSADGGRRSGRHFEFPMYREPDLFGDEAIQAVDTAVGEATRRQMVSDVPVGAFLSGGIDSPLVVAEMRNARQGPVVAFTISAENRLGDDAPDAAVYAAQLQVEHHIETFEPETLVRLLPETMEALSEPFSDSSLLPTLLVSRMARERVKVVLSGDGGDELFWGYVGRFSYVLRHARTFRLPYIARRLLGAAPRLRGGIGPNYMRYRSIGDWYLAKHTACPRPLIDRILPDLADVPDGHPAFQYEGWELEETAQWLRWNEFTIHLPRVLLKVDRASMHSSLEVRVPLLDRSLVELASRVHWATCLDLSSGVGKIPLRRALSRQVRHTTSVKRGFTLPLHHWLRGPLSGLVRSHLCGRKELGGIPVHRKSLDGWIERFMNGEEDRWWALWTVLSLAMWEDMRAA